MPSVTETIDTVIIRLHRIEIYFQVPQHHLPDCYNQTNI